jgi:hypothetical protein
MTVASLKDPATAVDTARRLMLAGTWKTVPKTGDDADKAVYTLGVHTPATLTVLPRVAAAALTGPVPPWRLQLVCRQLLRGGVARSRLP